MKYFSKEGVAQTKADFDMFISRTNLVLSKADELRERYREALREGKEKEAKEIEKEIEGARGRYEWQKPPADVFNVRIDEVLPVITLERYSREGKTYDVIRVLGEPYMALEVVGEKAVKGRKTGEAVYSRDVLDEEEAREIVESGERQKVFLLNALCVGTGQDGEAYCFHFPERIPLREGRFIAQDLNSNPEYALMYRMLLRPPFFKEESYESYREAVSRLENEEVKKLLAEYLEAGKNAEDFARAMAQALKKDEIAPLVRTYLLAGEKKREQVKEELKHLVEGEELYEELLTRMEERRKELRPRLQELRKGIFKKMISVQAKALMENLDEKKFVYAVKEGKKKYLLLRSSVPDYRNPLFEYGQVKGAKITFAIAPDAEKGKIVGVYRPFALNEQILPSYLKHFAVFRQVQGLIGYSFKAPVSSVRANVQEIKAKVGKLYRSRIEPFLEMVEKFIQIPREKRKDSPLTKDLIDVRETVNDLYVRMGEYAKVMKEAVPDERPFDHAYSVALTRAEAVRELFGLEEVLEVARERKEEKREEAKEEVAVAVKEEEEKKVVEVVEVSEEKEEEELLDLYDELLEEEFSALKEAMIREVRKR